MDTNDLNRRLRYALSLDDEDMLTLLRLQGYEAEIANVVGWRLKPDSPEYVDCPASAIHALLDGLILQNRGPRSDSVAPDASLPLLPLAQRIDNNQVLKQVRIALTLRTDQVAAFINAGGGQLGKSEVNALFRKPEARNFRQCGDQVLRWFLHGLAAQRDNQSDNQSKR